MTRSDIEAIGLMLFKAMLILSIIHIAMQCIAGMVARSYGVAS